MTGTEHLVPDAQGVLHASTVAFGNRAVLIAGRSGCGKSALALQLMALGAQLVSDDRTIVTALGTRLMASAPEPLRGLIEARLVGLLSVESVGASPVELVIDMEARETERLPPRRSLSIHGVEITMMYAVPEPYFPAAIAQYMRAGRKA